MVGRIITTPTCVAEGAEFLAGIEPRFAEALTVTGVLPLRLRNDGFQALLNAIIGQQISVAAASAIWGRMQTAQLTKLKNVKSASDDDLRGCGLSGQKIRYARALANSGIRYADLRDLPDDAVIAKLTDVTGIGYWTAQVYAMLSLGRADVFAPGDLALQEAARILFDLSDRPTEKQLRDMALAWSPWQSVAARLLWAYYRVAKQREGIT